MSEEETIDLEINNSADETFGLIKKKIEIGSISVNTDEDTNIVWMTSSRSNLLPDIHIKEQNINLEKVP